LGAFALRTGVAAVRLAVVAGILSTLVLVRSDVPFPLVAGGIAVCLAAILVLERDTARFRPWALYTVAFVVFAHLRGLADETGLAAQVLYPIELDRALFGAVPTVWLQEHLYVPGAPSAFDVACLAVYLSYFLVPHVVAFVLWRRSLERFVHYARAIVLTCYAGLAVSFVAPTAPPWLAGQLGDLSFVARIPRDIVDGVSATAYREGYEVVGANPVAAMPSLHAALTVVVAIAALRAGRVVGALGVGYALAMGFALVYLGEHYVADVLAGTLVAAVAWRVAAVGWRPTRKPRLSGAFPRLRG
jgi:membrane-associated phospholipid phosphatase